MSRQPLKISGQLIDELRAAYQSEEAVDQFTLRRLAHEVDKLLPVDPTPAYLGKALLAVLNHDAAEAARYAANYLRLDTSAAAFANVGMIYRRIGESAKAVACFMDAYAKAEQDTDFVEPIAYELSCLGRYAAAENMLVRLNRKNAKVEKLLSSIQEDMQSISEADIDFADVEAQLDIAYEVARTHNVAPTMYSIQACADEGNRSVLIALHIDGDDDLEYSLEYQLAEKLSALPSWAPERLNVAFECR
ncbi:hypothetical protein LJR038_000680 [Acidovorax sp. LjRoot38]|uniref:hypothetical protein n=1 Tax=Acidovorax sp. LjRoot38 TaxID=3342327 RepID=UPI003ECEBE14